MNKKFPTRRSTGKRYECVNMGSFNYLGLVDLSEAKTEHIARTIDQFGIAACSPNAELGT